jgi:uncharacterized protein with NRDE domain
MCTVTFLPYKDGCYITSSRDEHITRPSAIIPELYEHNNMRLLYPKDAKANGTWIACTQTGNAAVLLNGAFEKHVSLPPYRKSRGLIFLDIIAHLSPRRYFIGMNLKNIEPFTLVLFVSGNLFEARWDGEKKYFIQLDAAKPYIWSSATLYSPAVSRQRELWFDEWLTATNNPTADAVINFHRFAGKDDTAHSVLMNRAGQLLTFSITGVALTDEFATMRHFDVKNNTLTRRSLPLETLIN